MCCQILRRAENFSTTTGGRGKKKNILFSFNQKRKKKNFKIRKKIMIYNKIKRTIKVFILFNFLLLIKEVS